MYKLGVLISAGQIFSMAKSELLELPQLLQFYHGCGHANLHAVHAHWLSL